MDDRVHRTRERLSAAMLELICTKPISSITVSDIARHAGINRSTFYDHFKSPEDLLAKSLAADFAGMRKEYIRLHRAAVSAEDALRQGLYGLLEHVEARRRIYERTLTSTTTAGVVEVFTSAFGTACFHVLTEIAGTRLTRTQARTVATFAAAGVISAIRHWLEEGHLSRDELVEVLVDSFPHWWRGSSKPSQRSQRILTGSRSGREETPALPFDLPRQSARR